MEDNLQTYRNRIYAVYADLHNQISKSSDQNTHDLEDNLLISRLGGWLPQSRDDICLDCACGSGALLHALKKSGFKNLYGVDVSAQQVELALTVSKNVIQDDAIHYLSRHLGEYDFITAFDILEHFNKNEVFEFLDALYAALKPGGRLVIQTPNASSPWFGSVRYGDFTHELAFTPESLSRVLTVTGFTGFEARECPPYFHGIKSGARYVIWKLLRAGAISWNMVETGGMGSGIFTRVFIAKAEKHG